MSEVRHGVNFGIVRGRSQLLHEVCTEVACRLLSCDTCVRQLIRDTHGFKPIVQLEMTSDGIIIHIPGGRSV